MQTVYNEDYIYKVNILFNFIEVLTDCQDYHLTTAYLAAAAFAY